MIKKYSTIRDDMLVYMRNRITAGIGINEVSNEVMEKYPIQLAFYMLDDKMIREFIEEIARAIYFMYHNEHAK